jgi:3-oxoacyl-[acyl-carrier protein] reductase
MAVKDQVVIVTGAAQGHGRSIAVTFAAEGARLALVDMAPLDQVVQDCQPYEVEVLPIPTDLRQPEQVRAMVDRVQEHYGQIDVLINDAGINPHFRYGEPRWPLIDDMDPDFFDNIMRTNLFSTFLTTKYTLPHMKARHAGHIINFGQGGVGHGPSTAIPGSTVYTVSKVAIRAFTQSVAAEAKDYGICVMSFGPGGPGAYRPGVYTATMSPEQLRALAAEIDMYLGQRLVALAEAPMEFTGRMVMVRDDKLALAPDEVS